MPSAGEFCVTTHSSQHSVRPNLKLLRGRLRTRRSQNPERMNMMTTRARDSGFTHKFGTGNRREYRCTQRNQKMYLVEYWQRHFVRVVSKYHGDRVTMAGQKFQGLSMSAY